MAAGCVSVNLEEIILREVIGIMACSQNYVISNQGKLPWSVPEEVSFYRNMIRNQIVVMGYKTYQQMPASFFKNHTVIVFSRQHECVKSVDSSITIVASFDDFYNLNNLPENKKIYMIGGGEIATLFLKEKAIASFYLSEIDGYYPGDIFFPIGLIASFPRVVYAKGPGFTVYYYTSLKDKV